MKIRGPQSTRKQTSMPTMSSLRTLADVGNMAQRSSPPGDAGDEQNLIVEI